MFQKTSAQDMAAVTEKVCRKCGVSKPRDRFGKQSRSADGLFSWCKDCKRAYDKARYDSDPESARARAKKWNAENADRHRANVKQWQEKNRVELARRKRESRQLNPEHVATVRRAWTERNREKIAGQMRDYRASNPGYSRKLYWNNRESYVQKSARRRALRMKATTGVITPEGLASRLAYYGGRCWMCGAPWEHWDHVKPLSKGGAHMLSNLRPACASCNLTKAAQWPFYR